MLEKSKREIGDALKYSEAMKYSQTFEEFEINWKNFLESIYRAYNKAKNELKRTVHNENMRNKFLAKYENDLKKDQLLCYLKQARGVYEHTISDGAAEVMDLMPSAPETFVNKLVIKDGKIIEADIPVGGILLIKKPALLDVENRGVIYRVPNKHLGNKINPYPYEISFLALRYYKDFISKAEEFIIANI